MHTFRLFCIISIALFTTQTVDAQLIASATDMRSGGKGAQQTSTFGIFKKSEKMQRFSFFLTYHSFPMRTQESTVNFTYTDESPSPSALNQVISLGNTDNAAGIGGGVEWQSKRNLVYRIGIRSSRSNGRQTRGSAFSFGVGYAIGSPRFQLYPMVDFMLINGNMEFADLAGDGYTVINNVEFSSNSIKTELNTQFASIKPMLGLNVSILPWLGLHANAGYILNSAGGAATIEFSEMGTDINGKATTRASSEKLSDSNVSFVVDGTRQTEKLSVFKVGGLSWNVGVNININNNLMTKE